MSWRETINAQSATSRPFTGSLSGVPFFVPSNRMQGGRRTVVHELPQQNLPIIDDLGAKAKQFQLTVWVDATLANSGNYFDARDALLAVLDQPGPMTLVHPWLGRVEVSQSDPYRLNEDMTHGGRANFDLALVQNAGIKMAPTATADTQQHVNEAAEDLQLSALDQFASRWDVGGLADWGLAEIENDLVGALSAIESVADGITKDIAAQIRAPYNMGTAIVGSVNALRRMINVPLNAFNLYSNLFVAGDDQPLFPTTTPQRQQQATAQFALHQLIQLSAVAAAARVATTIDFKSSDEALASLRQLISAIDRHMLKTQPISGEPINDASFRSLDVLRASVSRDLRGRVAKLPELVTYTPPHTQPSLVLAWRLFGDSRRAAGIVARNSIRWPGFVAGGEALEVLND